MLYYMHDFNHAILAPVNAFARTGTYGLTHTFSPLNYSTEGRRVKANFEMLERNTRHFFKPAFGLKTTTLPSGEECKVTEEIVQRENFCHLIHFKKEAKLAHQPKILICAPLSGHYATLLRDTVRAMLPDHDVYITDWQNARDIPLIVGEFTLDNYISYIMDFLRIIGPGTHVMAVCQPAVPVTAATALMSQNKDKCVPASLTLMGGPIDSRNNPTAVNKQAKEHPISWFRKHVITHVPYYYPGAWREVCPGFLMLSGFMSMNLERHVTAHKKFYEHLIQGDEESAASHRQFYDEFMSVLDLPAEYYLESVRVAFQDHDLPKNKMKWNGHKVDVHAIDKTPILAIEGELDDISGLGQTKAVHDITPHLPADKKQYHQQKAAGHYGIFNGSKWRNHIMPVVREFIKKHD